MCHSNCRHNADVGLQVIDPGRFVCTSGKCIRVNVRLCLVNKVEHFTETSATIFIHIVRYTAVLTYNIGFHLLISSSSVLQTPASHVDSASLRVTPSTCSVASTTACRNTLMNSTVLQFGFVTVKCDTHVNMHISSVTNLRLQFSSMLCTLLVRRNFALAHKFTSAT